MARPRLTPSPSPSLRVGCTQGDCSGGDVVRCAWNGGHNWLFDDAVANGFLVTDFLLRWTKPSHQGGGVNVEAGFPPTAAGVKGLLNVTVVEEDTEPVATHRTTALPQTLEAVEERCDTAADCTLPCPHPDVNECVDGLCGCVAAADGNSTASGGAAAKGHHYGDPEQGCRDDEDVILAGKGHVCAPRIGTAAPAADSADPPPPKCMLGGVVSNRDNGCPFDARVSAKSKAFPICLARGMSGSPDPYSDGDFHCLLVCPCDLQLGNDCGHKAHRHCPGRSTCQRGELRNMAQGVCTYAL